MSGRLADRVAVVFGGSGGIGRAACIAMAQEGAKVVVSDVNTGAIASLVETIQAAGGEATGITADISKLDQVQNVYAAAFDRYGQVDVVFTAHGVQRRAMVWEMTDEQWDEVINVHLKGTFYALREIAKHFVERRRGHFIAITSPAGTMGQAGQVNYCAAKAGTIGLIKGAARELAPYNVNLNLLNPIAATPLTARILADERLLDERLRIIPFRRFAEPEEIAPAVVFLACDDSGYMTGELLNVTGGRTM